MTATPTATRPVPGPTRTYHFPQFERGRLSNGLRVVVAPIHRLPIATMMAVVDGGALWDEQGREGTAALTAKLLLEGAAEFDGAELTERFEQLGASIESGADWDAAVVSMTVTSHQLDKAAALFARVLQQPLFRVREVERLKAERIADIMQSRAEPRGLADEAFAAAVYAASSRYSQALGGSDASVEAIEQGVIQALYASRYAPTTTTLIVAGDITAAAALELIQNHFGAWQGNAAQGARRADVPARNSRALHHVIRADAPQSEVRLGHMGVPRTHEDYFDIVVMNAILGGLFNSRINMNLREAHAYTYGAFSAFDWRRDAGPFLVSTAVRTDVTTESIDEVVKEIARMRSEPVQPQELSLATSYLDGVFPIRYETTAAVASALANQIIFGLPDDYYDTYRDRIRAVTVESVHRAATKHLQPGRLQAVVVGDVAIGDKLRKMSFGDFVQREAADV